MIIRKIFVTLRIIPSGIKIYFLFLFLFTFIKNIFLEIHVIELQCTMMENKNYETNWFSFLEI